MNYQNMTSKVSLFIALAPAAYVHHQRSPLLKILADDHVGWILKELGVKSFLPNSKILEKFGIVCDIIQYGCEMALFLVTGPSSPKNINGSRLDYYLNWEPADTSVHNLIHWSQGVRVSDFEMFNWGDAKKNMQHYNQSTPPAYPIKNITLPVAFFYGGQDWLADPQDCAVLLSDLPHVVYDNFQESYAHMDFVWGLDAHQLIYPNVTLLAQKYAT